MKLVFIFLVVVCLCEVHAQSRSSISLYLRFFCRRNNHPVCRAVPSPQTPKTTTKPRRPPRPPSRPRIIAPPGAGTRPTPRPRPQPSRSTTRTPSVTVCERIEGKCTEGKFLADIFASNLVAPQRGGVKAPGSSRGGSQTFPTGAGSSGSSRGGTSTNTGRGSSRVTNGRTSTNTGRRTTSARTFGPAPSPSSVKPQTSTVATSGGSRGRGGGRTLPLVTKPCVVRNITDRNGNVIAGSCVTPRTAATRSKRRTYRPVQSKRDLLIMMDESGSVGYYRFAKVKRIASAIVRLLCHDIRVHPSYTRVAVTSFDAEVHYHVRLISPHHQSRLDRDNDALADYIYDNIRYSARTQSNTCLIDALEHAYTTALDSRYGGRRGYKNVEQDIILISDGCENCVRPEYHAHQRIREITSFFISENINVYVIGIGLRERCKETLSLLAQGGRCFHFFYLTNWDYIVDDFLYQLEHPPAGICLSSFETAEGQCVSNFG